VFHSPPTLFQNKDLVFPSILFADLWPWLKGLRNPGGAPRRSRGHREPQGIRPTKGLALYFYSFPRPRASGLPAVGWAGAMAACRARARTSAAVALGVPVPGRATASAEPLRPASLARLSLPARRRRLLQVPGLRRGSRAVASRRGDAAIASP